MNLKQMELSMAVCPPVFLSRCLLSLLLGVVLLLLPGCAQKNLMPHDDISGRLWLRTSNQLEGLEGFFTGTDGQLLLVNELAADGISWALQDDRLVLWLHAEDLAVGQSAEYHPLLIEGKLVLSPDLAKGSAGYVAETLQEPLSNIDYFPTYLRGSPDRSPGKDNPPVYLQLDAGDKSLRGYGGVNNFRGSYQRTGAVGFKVGPMATTMMAGPRMDYETKLLQCLDQADAMLPLGKRLFFYQNARLLCSFSAD